MAYRLNLAYKTVLELEIFHTGEELIRLVYAHFAYSPKKRAKFHTLAQLMETKGLKMLKQVKTRWINMIKPLRQLLAKYRSLMEKMYADHNEKKWRKKALIRYPLL